MGDAPTTYNENTETFTLPSVTKNGWDFIGWTGGKNLVELYNGSWTINGMTVTINNYTLTLNGTTTDEVNARTALWKNITFTAKEGKCYSYTLTNPIPNANYGYYKGTETTTYTPKNTLQNGTYYFGIYLHKT